MYDKNRDGKLSPSERMSMMAGIREGKEKYLYKKDDLLFDNQLSSWIL